MSSKDTNNNGDGQTRKSDRPKPVIVTPNRNIRSGVRPAYEAPKPPKN